MSERKLVTAMTVAEMQSEFDRIEAEWFEVTDLCCKQAPARRAELVEELSKWTD
jgi:hypothetical protein